MKQRIEKIIKKFKRKGFNIEILEKLLIESVGGESQYTSKGGYKTFADIILALVNEGVIREIKSSTYYYKKPYLKSKYQRITEATENSWDAYVFMFYSDFLDLSYYKKYIKAQKKQDLKYIKRIYNFIKTRDERLIASREERALELFDDEKYFNTEKNILKRIKLNSYLGFRNFDEALKMKKYTQMFVYYENKKITNNKILIVENQSTFFTVRKLMMENHPFFSKKYKFLLWGQGKGIISQLEMLSMIVTPKAVVIDYFGDIDPEGYFIFLKLKEKFPALDLQLLVKAYEVLLDEKRFYNYTQKQNKNAQVLKGILEYFKNEEHRLIIKNLWHKNQRIPQEIITLEFIKRRENNGHI